MRQPGIEPGSPGWKPGIRATKLPALMSMIMRNIQFNKSLLIKKYIKILKEYTISKGFNQSKPIAHGKIKITSKSNNKNKIPTK